jgi:hypothetical protein
MNRALTRVALLVGALWGIVALACVLSIGTLPAPTHIARSLVVFVVCGALVGWSVGLGLARLRSPTAVTMCFLSGATLIVATGVFGLLTTIGNRLLPMGRRYAPPLAEEVLQAPLWWLYGLFAGGFVLLLWPLALLSHTWFFQVRDRDQNPQALSELTRG